MTTWPDCVADVVADLHAAGLQAVTDPRSAAAPCVLLIPDRLTQPAACVTEVEVTVWAVAPDTGTGDGWAWLINTAAPVLLPHVPVLEADDYEGRAALRGTLTRQGA